VEFSESDIGVMPSAAPVFGTVSRRYTNAVRDLTEKSTRLGLGARIVLFATRQDFAGEIDSNAAALPVYWRGVQLLDSEGRVRLDLPGENGRDDGDRYEGRASFSSELKPGGYFLKWPMTESDDGRSALQPLWIAVVLERTREPKPSASQSDESEQERQTNQASLRRKRKERPPWGSTGRKSFLPKMMLRGRHSWTESGSSTATNTATKKQDNPKLFKTSRL
jgi:hypothetical protein